MMAGLVKEVLRRVCVDYGWCYGVFWKIIGCGDQIAHLVWEDGHYERGSQIDDFVEDQVEVLLFKMMANQVHVIGDGLVGKAALTGNHEWVVDDRSIYKGFAEINNQLLADIKTVVSVPVLPHGVVQLGSTHMVLENFGFIDHVKRFFEQLHSIPGALSCNTAQNNLHYNVQRHESVNMQASIKQFGEVGTNINSLASLNNNNIDQMLVLKNATPCESNSQIKYQPPMSLPYSKCTYLEEELMSMSGITNSHKPALDNDSNTNTNQLQSYGLTSEIIPSFSTSQLPNSTNELGKFNQCSSSSLQSTSTNDLFDALSLDQYKSIFSHDNLNDFNGNTHELSNDVSACINELEVGPLYNALNDENFCGGMFSEGGKDQLLDAVVSQFNSVSKYEMDDNESCKTTLTNSSPKITNAKTFGIPPMHIKCEPAASGSVKSSCSTEGSGSYKSQINLWIEGQKLNLDDHPFAQGKKVDDVVKVNKKRSKPGENPRPRPKDRQMIQDRVKELREIIPNGAKCSIDALLEKTIKHMLFLQSVTKHADRLKETGEPKIISSEGGLLLKDNFEGGATWAFEVGSQAMICPIIVEDLNPPRQLLVEMLCEERGLFLEIADLVRGLGLTILKGVMEARRDKVWARFAVEANRDVTRMEIFLSLVRLLEPGYSKTLEGDDNLNEPHSMFPSPSYIPATGSSDRLW